MSRDDVLAVVRQHAKFPLSMSWAELGIKVLDAREIVARVDSLNDRLSRAEQTIRELKRVQKAAALFLESRPADEDDPAFRELEDALWAARGRRG